MTHGLHGQKECPTAQELKYKISKEKNAKTKAQLRGLLDAHKKNCPTCGGKVV